MTTPETPSRILQELDAILAAAQGLGTESEYLTSNLTAANTTIPRTDAINSAVATGTGSLRLTFFDARASMSTANVRVYSGGTAAGATPTLVRFGLYSVAANGAGTLVASTPNDTTLLAAQATAYTKAWSAPVELVAGQRYAFAHLVVTAAAAPTLVGNVLGDANMAAVTPRLAGLLTAQSDLPASFTNAALSVTAHMAYAAFLS